MRVLRGRDRTPAADRARSRELLEWAGSTGDPAVRVWRPHRQVAFGRRDAHEAGYAEARAAAARHGFPPVERDVGGRAVAYTGSTIAFARFLPLEDPRRGLEDRYRALMEDVQVALERVGVDARPGEPPDSFCAGDYSLQADGKVVGIAQRVTADAAVVSGILVVDQHEAIAEVLADVYAALSVSFDPDSVGSVARAGGAVDRVRAELEDVLVGEEPVQIERLRSR